MANVNAPIDDNRAAVGLALDGDDSTQVLPLYVDPSTKRLQIELAESSLPATLSPSGKIDANRQPIAYAVTDDANLTIVPISTDANGLLLVDLISG